MVYREIKPHPSLAPFVRCFWYLERDYRVPGTHEVVWPDGKTELLFLPGAPYQQGGETLPPAMLIGPLTRPITLTSPGVVRLAGVRFHPWGLWPYFRTPVRSLRDRIIPYADLAGAEADDLVRQIARADLTEAVAILERSLLNRLEAGSVANHPLVAPLAQAITAANGALPVSELERRGGVTARHLERLFNDVVGLSPKKLSVILRFDQARRTLFFNPGADLTDVAHQIGYYDHPHFVRDFRAHFGMTPTEFRDWTVRQRVAFSQETSS